MKMSGYTSSETPKNNLMILQQKVIVSYRGKYSVSGMLDRICWLQGEKGVVLLEASELRTC